MDGNGLTEWRAFSQEETKDQKFYHATLIFKCLEPVKDSGSPALTLSQIADFSSLLALTKLFETCVFLNGLVPGGLEQEEEEGTEPKKE